jgi:hypothetical protein
MIQAITRSAPSRAGDDPSRRPKQLTVHAAHPFSECPDVVGHNRGEEGHRQGEHPDGHTAENDPFLSRTADQQPSYGESGSVHREQQTVASVFPFLIQLDNVFP